MPEAHPIPRGAVEPDRALISAGAEFEGLLLLHGPARLEGDVRGAIIGTALWVGRSASIDARVEVDEIFVQGRVAGEVRVRGRALLRSTARVTASLEAASLVLEEGSLLEGHCRMRPASDPQNARPEGALLP